MKSTVAGVFMVFPFHTPNDSGAGVPSVAGGMSAAPSRHATSPPSPGPGGADPRAGPVRNGSNLGDPYRPSVASDVVSCESQVGCVVPDAPFTTLPNDTRCVGYDTPYSACGYAVIAVRCLHRVVAITACLNIF